MTWDITMLKLKYQKQHIGNNIILFYRIWILQH